MAFVVISECVVAETGRRFEPGQFLPEGVSDATALRLERVGCVREVDLDALDKASPEALIVLKAAGISNAADAARAQAMAEAGQAAHGSVTTSTVADQAALQASLDADEAAAREGMMERLSTEEGQLRTAMTTRIGQEEASARTELQARLAQEEADGRTALQSRLATEEEEGKAAIAARLADPAAGAPAGKSTKAAG